MFFFRIIIFPDWHSQVPCTLLKEFVARVAWILQIMHDVFITKGCLYKCGRVFQVQLNEWMNWTSKHINKYPEFFHIIFSNKQIIHNISIFVWILLSITISIFILLTMHVNLFFFYLEYLTYVFFDFWTVQKGIVLYLVHWLVLAKIMKSYF